jgi:hypothetical protein
MKGTVTFATAVMLLGFLAIPVGFAGQNGDYKVISFDVPEAGTLPYNQNNGVSQGTGCYVITACNFAINQRGAVVGTYLDANNVYHGFLRSPQGQYTTIDAPCADTTAQDYNGTVAESINDLGEIAGFCIDIYGDTHGFVRSPQGTFTVFDALNEEPTATVPLFINIEGATVGFVFDTNSLGRAFVRYPNGTLTVFVGPGSCAGGTNLGTTAYLPGAAGGCYGQEATYVNLVGDSVGNFEDNSGNFVAHGMIRSPDGKFTIFDAPGAGTGPYQGTGCPGCDMGVNYFGVITGSYIDAKNLSHGFLRYPDGRFVTFEATGAVQGTGVYGPGYGDTPMRINDSDEITGSYWDSTGMQHGFLRTPDGSFVTIDPQGSAGTLPEGVNDSGAITGFYADASGVYHGFLATRR